MKKILIVGAGGQIGSELTMHLRGIYGNNNVEIIEATQGKTRLNIEDNKIFGIAHVYLLHHSATKGMLFSFA